MRYHITHSFSPHMRETPEGCSVCFGVSIARINARQHLPKDFDGEPPVTSVPSGGILVVRTRGYARAPAIKENHMSKPAADGRKAGFPDRFSGCLKKGEPAGQAGEAAIRDEEAAGDTQTARNGGMPGKIDDRQPAADTVPDRSGNETMAALAALTAKVEEMGLMLHALLKEKGAPGTGTETTGNGDAESTAGSAAQNAGGGALQTGGGEASHGGGGDASQTDQPGRSRPVRRIRVADAATVRRARAISPGIAVRVGDSLEAAQKFVLRQACRDAALKVAVDGFLSGRAIDSLSLSELNSVFCATAELAKHINNQRTAGGVRP